MKTKIIFLILCLTITVLNDAVIVESQKISTNKIPNMNERFLKMQNMLPDSIKQFTLIPTTMVDVILLRIENYISEEINNDWIIFHNKRFIN